LRVLDIGCGSGFYTNFWRTRGVTKYVGLDISASTFTRLRREFIDYEFIQADITSNSSDLFGSLGQFDIITIFDVLYHIVDARQFKTAIANVGTLSREGGNVLIIDQLQKREYQLSRHVIHRAEELYLSEFRQHRLDLVDSELLFHFMLPPITGYRLFDYPAAAAFKLSGLVLRQSDSFAKWTARKVRSLDSSLRSRGIRLANSQLLMFVNQPERPNR
jgi:SAM-dependent methyltransferase